jgi:Amt family ammonium transporter
MVRPAGLITGAFAERIKFPTFVVFTVLWATLVYFPIAHWVWGKEGWLRNLGALDFAGGTVVHVSSGLSALVFAL